MTIPAGVAPFANHLPVRIRFGPGEATQLGTILEREQITRMLVVIDAGLERVNEPVAATMRKIKSSPVRLELFEKPAGEPSNRVVDSATAALTTMKADGVVAIGGGSVMDTAKAARLCAQLSSSFEDLTGTPSVFPAPTVPLIAVPTTAGTGAEVSGGVVVTDKVARRKIGLANPNLRATYAVVDPLLTHAAPPDVTAYTGIDALAQAIAAIIAKTSTPIGDAIALEAIRLIGRSLTRAHRDPENAPAREEVACGSLMAGLAMNISDCAAEHALAQAIGSLLEAPHGLTVGLVLAETLDRERTYAGDKLERIADALDLPDHGLRDGSRTVGAIRNLLAELDFPVLGSLGVDETQLGELTDRALLDPLLAQAPEPWAEDDVRAAFEAALACRDRRRA